MRSSKLVILSVMAAVLVFAAATSAYAAGSGTVYGQATMQPTVSIVLSGAGSDAGNPLTYAGRAGENVPNNNGIWITVANNGDVATPLLLGWGSDPTDGVTTWTLNSTFADATNCTWDFVPMFPSFDIARVPANGELPVSFGPTALDVGESVNFATFFGFPTSFDGSTHTMTALIIAGS